MILFIQFLRAVDVEVSKKLLGVPIWIMPYGTATDAYLSMSNNILQLNKDATSIARVEHTGSKEYSILLKGAKLCENKRKQNPIECTGPTKEVSVLWNIKRVPNTPEEKNLYSIKGTDSRLGRQYCLTFEPSLTGPVKLKSCKNNRENQSFTFKCADDGLCGPKKPNDPPAPPPDAAETKPDTPPEVQAQQAASAAAEAAAVTAEKFPEVPSASHGSTKTSTRERKSTHTHPPGRGDPMHHNDVVVVRREGGSHHAREVPPWHGAS